jgi:hypothetical protein
MTCHKLASVVCALGLLGCGPWSPGPRTQAALDRYAPGFRLGAPVPAAARRRYRLRVAPYMGYRDSAYAAPGGLRDLGVEVDAYVDDANPSVPAGARVASVRLRTDAPATTAQLEAQLRAALGTPRVDCYTTGLPGRWRRTYWPGRWGRGVQLLTAVAPPAAGPGAVSAGTPAHVRPPPSGTGVVTFGAEAPGDRFLSPAPCP